MAKKKSASQIAAENEYYAKHNIVIPNKKDSIFNDVKPELLKPSQSHENESYSSKEWEEYIMSINSRVVQMEDKELVPLLLKFYDNILQTIIKPDFVSNTERIKNFLKLQKCEDGVCFISRHKFGVLIYDRSWIKENKKGNKLYWYDIPRNLYTSKELIESISFRVKTLNEILNSLK